MSNVKLCSVTKEYGTGETSVHALREVSFELSRGDFAVIAGPSGSGKSTLLNIIGALDKPTSGTVEIDAQELTKLSRTELSKIRRERIGFVFQNYNLIPVLTAMENAEYVLMLQGTPKEERKERVFRLFKEIGLEGKEKRFPKELSGGQQQRVAIARAIVSQPALVLADEPTANVDSKTAHSLLELMKMLNEEKGITFIFSSHDQAVIQLAKRLFMLKDGQIVPSEQSDTD